MKKSQDLHVVLLAGGSGTRFWPLSRGKRPKQFLALAGGKPLVAETWDRVRKLAPPTRIWVVAPKALKKDILKALPKLRPDRLVLEPSPRDTAPAVALACAHVAAVAPKAVVSIFPTDHVIRDEKAFCASVEQAASAARQGSLVCLGIRPDQPATGYGYLKCRTRVRGGKTVDVERFVEKPSLARAKKFLATGSYLWNAGMFVWQAKRFLDELGRTAPEIAAAVSDCVAGKRGAWERATRLSVDYAVMEKARGVRVVPLDAGWDDVGSWEAAGRLRDEAGDHDPDAILVDSPGSVVFGRGRVIALVDMPDVAVVDTPDALLIVPRASSEKVREVVAELKSQKRSKLL